MQMKTFLIILAFISTTINAQTQSKITKIVLASGYCFNCGDIKMEFIEIDSTLKYSYYKKEFEGEFSFSEGKATQEMWNSFNLELKKYNKKELGSKKPFHIRNARPIVIEIFRGTKSAIYYNDVDLLSDELWKLYERILNSYKEINLENKSPSNNVKINNQILNFLKATES